MTAPTPLAETIARLERDIDLNRAIIGGRQAVYMQPADLAALLACARRCEAIEVPKEAWLEQFHRWAKSSHADGAPDIVLAKSELRRLLDAASERDALAKQAAKTKEELLLELESFSAAYQREHDEALAKLQLMEPVDSTLAIVRRVLSDAGVPVLDSKKRAYETESRILLLAQERDALAKRVGELEHALESQTFVLPAADAAESARLRAENERLASERNAALKREFVYGELAAEKERALTAAQARVRELEEVLKTAQDELDEWRPQGEEDLDLGSGSVSRLHASLAPKFPLAVLHARNVDKQRRRLLALKCSHKARTCDMAAHAAVDGDPEYARWLVGHASKLRAIAARLTSPSQ